MRKRGWSLTTRLISLEQIAATADVVGNATQWMKEEDICTVTLFEGNPIVIAPPTFVELEITETDPGLKGDTSSGGNKPATLETGAVVRTVFNAAGGTMILVR